MTLRSLGEILDEDSIEMLENGVTVRELLDHLMLVHRLTENVIAELSERRVANEIQAYSEGRVPLHRQIWDAADRWSEGR